MRALEPANAVEPSRTVAGFSLIELMVATAVLLVVLAGVTQTFLWQNRAYTIVDQTTDSQQNMRAIAYLMERDARVSGFMVPEAASACAVDLDTGSDTLFLTDAAAIDPTTQVQAALRASVAPGGGDAASTGSTTLQVDDVVLDGQPFYDTNSDGLADSDFQVGGGAIALYADAPAAGTACGIVEGVAANQVQIDFLTTLPAGAGAQLVVVPAHVYAINANAITRDGVALASDVEDLQAAFFFDLDGDGQIAANGETPGAAGEPLYQSDAWDHRTLREIRLNLVVRTRDADVEQREGVFQATENRQPIAGTDGFRRRVHTTTVRPRNVGYRGLAG